MEGAAVGAAALQLKLADTENKPGGHAAQAVAPMLGWKFPGAQPAHEFAPLAENLPAWHEMQDSTSYWNGVLTTLYFPAGHFVGMHSLLRTSL